jgi:hypothetical protein
MALAPAAHEAGRSDSADLPLGVQGSLLHVARLPAMVDMTKPQSQHGGVSSESEVSNTAPSEPFRWVSPQEIIGDDEGRGLSGTREPRRPLPPHRPDAAEEATPPSD